ncbi:MAG: PHB depolymerase family esterase, partial [Bacteroidota bacterium]
REYTVFLPSDYQEGVSLPMIFNLHGFGSNGTQQLLYSTFNLVADTANVIVVYPEGLDRTTSFGWNGTHWNSYFGTDGDDLGFLNLLIDQVYTDYNIDLTRVYSTGMSNGGFMSYRLACELSNRITAIASVTGNATFEQLDNCTPSRPVPILQIHGTDDDIVPYNGTPLFSPSIPDLIDFWVTYNNCDTDPIVVDIDDTDMTDNSTAQILQYNNGDDDSEVWLYVVDGGTHTWPGAAANLPGSVTNFDFNSSIHIWDFFKKYTHPNPDAGTIVSTKNELFQNVEIFAQPTYKKLIVRSDRDDIQNLRLWDVMGKLVLEDNQLIGQRALNIDVPNIQTGIYVVTVETSAGAISKKVFFQ